ncbi:hypothetical protein JW824_14310 [bacterium]|nr:hypothetical protein [bacterium]
MIKKTMVFVIGCLMMIHSAFSQIYVNSTQENSSLGAGLGMAWIDEQPYYVISIQPDINIGKFGLGLGINLLYDKNEGKIRSEDWNSGYDFFRILRYFRYQHKGETLYGRIGALDNERIGHGFILNHYTNQIDYDERKIGLVLDVDLGYLGFESLTNNIGRFEVIGGRGYIRPLYGSRIPVLKHFAVGGSYVTDIDPDSWTKSKDNVSVWSVDIELPFIKTDRLLMMFYGDHAKIQKYGSGQTIGFNTTFNTASRHLSLEFNVERRFLGREFIANYFGPFYEILRYTTVGELIEFYEAQGGDPLGIPPDLQNIISPIRISQEMLLPMMGEKRKGWSVSLVAELFQLIRGMVAYQKMDEYEESGMLHMGAGLSPSIPFLYMEATYDKRNIRNWKDLRTLDYRSTTRAGIGLKLKTSFVLSMDYIWSYQWDGRLEQYRPQERFQPTLSYQYTF